MIFPLSVPSETHKVSVSSVGPQGLLVKWKTPDIGHPILMYILHYYPGISPKDNVTIYTHRLNYTLKNLLVETQYIIHVSKTLDTKIAVKNGI